MLSQIVTYAAVPVCVIKAIFDFKQDHEHHEPPEYPYLRSECGVCVCAGEGGGERGNCMLWGHCICLPIWTKEGIQGELSKRGQCDLYLSLLRQHTERYREIYMDPPFSLDWCGYWALVLYCLLGCFPCIFSLFQSFLLICSSKQGISLG